MRLAPRPERNGLCCLDLDGADSAPVRSRLPSHTAAASHERVVSGLLSALAASDDVASVTDIILAND